MDRRILITSVAGVVVVAVAAVAAWKVSGLPGSGTTGGNGNQSSSGDAGGNSGPQTKFAVPPNTQVPDANSSTTGDVAVPKVVNTAAPGVSAKYRSFDISIYKDDFSPKEVIINEGDTAHINFRSVDKQYDIVQPDNGFKLIIPKGQTKVLEGQFPAAGKFLFYCESCGGPEKGPVGYITVVPLK